MTFPLPRESTDEVSQILISFPLKTWILDLMPTGWVQPKLLGVVWGLLLWTQRSRLWKVNVCWGNIYLALSIGVVSVAPVMSPCAALRKSLLFLWLSSLESDVAGLSSLQCCKAWKSTDGSATGNLRISIYVQILLNLFIFLNVHPLSFILRSGFFSGAQERSKFTIPNTVT